MVLPLSPGYSGEQLCSEAQGGPRTAESHPMLLGTQDTLFLPPQPSHPSWSTRAAAVASPPGKVLVSSGTIKRVPKVFILI